MKFKTSLSEVYACKIVDAFWIASITVGPTVSNIFWDAFVQKGTEMPRILDSIENMQVTVLI